MEGRLQASIYAVLYRGLEHVCILVSTGGSGTNPLQMLRNNLTFGGVKSYRRIFDLGGSVCAPNPHIAQGSIVHVIMF